MKELFGVGGSSRIEGHESKTEGSDRGAERSLRAHSFATTGLFVLATFYTLDVAREFFIPVVLAIIFNFFLSPFVRALKRFWVPEYLGAAIVMIAGAAIIGAIVYELSAPVTEWAARAPEITGKIAKEMQKLKRPVQKVTQATEQVSRMTNVSEGDQSHTTSVEVKRPSILEGLVVKTRDAIFGLVVLVVLLYFLLSSGDLFLRKLIHVLPRFEDKKRAVLIARQIEDHISKYLVTVALINACLGTAGGLVFWALGMPNPALWGATGFILNFIPYIGALTEIVIVTLVATATFPHIGHALIVPASYLTLATIEGNFVTPYVMGRRMTLNRVIVFVAVTFWGWMWGILGIFLAVPTLVMFKIFCDHIEPLAPIGEFLGS